MPSPIIQVVSDDRFKTHRGPDGHPERPERLVAIGEVIDEFRDLIDLAEPRQAEAEEIMRVHDGHLVSYLESSRERPLAKIDEDTFVSPASYDVARLAAGGCIDLARRVMAGEIASGLAAVRPPGHHAEANRAMGFCLFNNVAIAARALQAQEDTPRILIFDWDVHHGNGTQHIFESDRDVLYISTHQFPFYPGTGTFSEAGLEQGFGSTINIPMPAGCGDSEYIGVLQRIVVPATLAFRPDVIFVSCGFDAHADDPLASMRLTQDGYRAMSAIMRSLADTVCGGRIVFVLEGGYSLLGVREGATAVLESLTAASAPEIPRVLDLEPGSNLNRLIDGVAQIHGGRIRDLGSA